MDSILHSESLALARLMGAADKSASFHHRLPCFILFPNFPARRLPAGVSSSVSPWFHSSDRSLELRGSSAVAACGTLMANSVPPRSGVYTVGDFMTRKEDLHVVKATTTVDEALEMLVENRITGFPVIDGDWKLVGLVSDYDLLALDSISGGSRPDNSMFPEADSNWKVLAPARGRLFPAKTFNEVQKLLSKTNGKVVGDLMTPAPLVVRETTNLEDAARLLLKTKYRRLPVVDGEGKLVGIITRGNVVRAALQIKRAIETKVQ